MSKLNLSRDWLSELVPQGLEYPSSTLISGPGGSGKPLVGLSIVYDWLNAGGNVIFVPLQYPKMNFVRTSLDSLYDVDITDYSENVGYVQFDLNLDNWNREEENLIRANLLKPEVWDEVIRVFEGSFGSGDPGNLVFASALNLMLFSPTYKTPILDKIEEFLGSSKERTCLFASSTSAFREEVRRWEDAADNLLFTRMEENMGIFLSVERLENEEVESKEIRFPVEKENLEKIKKVAKGVKNKKIPELRKV